MDVVMYDITGLDLKYAGYLADVIDVADRDSDNKLILVERQDVIGYLGEMSFEKYLMINDIDYQQHEIYDRPVHGSYDYLINGLKFDVKSEKASLIPDEDWIVFVRDYQIQKYLSDPIDYLIFIVINMSLMKAYILGGISFMDFLEHSILKKRGESIMNRFTLKEDAWIMRSMFLEPLNRIFS